MQSLRCYPETGQQNPTLDLVNKIPGVIPTLKSNALSHLIGFTFRALQSFSPTSRATTKKAKCKVTQIGKKHTQQKCYLSVKKIILTTNMGNSFLCICRQRTTSVKESKIKTLSASWNQLKRLSVLGSILFMDIEP